MCGNLYCGSVYGSLASLLSNVDSSSLQGKGMGIFGHFGGLASRILSLTVVSSTDRIRRTLCLKERLAVQIVETPEIYRKVQARRFPLPHLTNKKADVFFARENLLREELYSLFKFGEYISGGILS